MVATINGVRVDEQMFPRTYRIRKLICNMAIRFHQPFEDMLQDSMVIEFDMQSHPDKYKPKTTENQAYRLDMYLRKAAFLRALNVQQRYQYRHVRLTEGVHDEREDSTPKVERLIVYSKADMYNRIFIDEVAQILKAKDEVLYEIMQYRRKDLRMSWRAIYQERYAGRRSMQWFFNKVKAIRGVCTEVMARNADLVELLNLGSVRTSSSGIFIESEVLGNSNASRYACPA